MKKHLFLKSLLIAIGLLIASINTAWATTYYVRGTMNSWSATAMTQSSSNTNLYYYKVSGSQEFKVATSTTSWDYGNGAINNEAGYIISLGGSDNITGGGSGESWYICFNSSTKKVYGVFSMNVTGDNWGTPAIGNWTTTGKEMDYDGNNTFTQTITSVAASEHKFKITRCSSGSGNWDNAVGYSNKVTGTNCTKAAEDGDGSNIKFTPYIAGDVTITYNKSTGNITIACTAPTITFDKEGGDGGTSSQSTPYGTVTSNISAPSMTGHDFGGYWTGDNGTGTQIIGSNGAWIKNKPGYTTNETPCKWAVTANGKLYAKWTPGVYNITWKDQGNTTYSGSNSASLPPSYTYGTGIASLTAGVKTGYTFGGWYTNSACTEGPVTSISSSATGAKTFYAKWTIKNYDISYTDPSNGSYTVKVGSSAAVSDDTNADYGTTITLAATANDGYHFTGWTVNKDGGGSVTPSSSATANPATFSMPDDDVTVAASFAVNTYTVTFNKNGGSGDTMDSESFTYGTSKNLTANTYTRTGYTFQGWATSKANADAGTVAYADGAAGHLMVTANGATVELFAVWQANNYTVTLSCTGEPGYGSSPSGVKATVSATYGSTMPAMGTAPTPAPGYKFMGYYASAGGVGTQYYAANGSSVTNWNVASATTLHAYFQKTEISSLEHPASIAKGDVVTVDVNPVFNQDGAQNYMDICWSLLYDNDNPVESGWTVAAYAEEGKPRQVRFTLTGLSSGYYKIQAVLKANASSGFTPCSAGTELCTFKSNLRIAGNSKVTIQYQDASGNVLRENGTVEVARGDEVGIKAPNIIGYAFKEWVLGDVLDSACVNSAICGTKHDSINITAAYDGYLTAKYTKKNMIYFNNTLEWDTVYVYFYSTNRYWDDTYGSGASTEQSFGLDSHKPHYRGFWGGMTRIAGTNVYYFDYEDKIANSSWNSEIRGYTNVAFAKDPQGTPNGEYKNGYNWFDDTEVVRREDYSTDLSMYVPLNVVTCTKNEHDSKSTKYYEKGYWMNYPEGTGYTLKIYDNNTSGALKKSLDFTFPADMKMPMSITTDLEAGKTYGFKIERADATSYGNTGTMTNGHSGDKAVPDWEFKSNVSNRCGLTTSSAGNYVFTLTYGQDLSSNYNYLVGVHYPEATGDYRVLYKDNVHNNWLTSAVIPKNLDHDTISYFVRKAQSPVMKLQKCSATWDGAKTTVTWTDTVDNLISSLPDAITGDGVYYFCINKKEDGSRELGDTKPYDGNFYIRVDGAGYSNWDNFRASDHLMPYSDYSFKQTTDPYSHYFCKWYDCSGGSKNIKFVVANDYSVCISDTITQDGVADSYVNSIGALSRSANVRFMYNYKTNAATRRYVDGAQGVGSDDFLKVLLPDGVNVSIRNYNDTRDSAVHEVKFKDNGDWVYEADIKAKPGTTYKLRSHFGVAPNEFNQYFKGKESGAGEYETLIGGTGDSLQIRLLYDYKTNRVVSAYIPSGTINSDLAIHADIMFMREHQGNVQQITFGNNAAITDIENIYCGLKFNKYTLNNLNKEAPHGLLPSLLSRYERDIFYVSFPYDVRLSDVIGFGTYGTHWIVEYYDGAARAKDGFWIDSESYWKFVTPAMKDTFTLKAGTGYIVALDLDELWYINDTYHADIWNNTSEVELLFPGDVSTISNQAVTYNMPIHQCTINRGTTYGNRTIKDSHWNVLGVPTFKNITGADSEHGGGSGALVFANTAWIEDSLKNDLKFIYDGNLSDNSLTAKAVKGFEFKAMHAYVVQYCGNVTFTTSATPAPSSIVARRTYAEKPVDVDFRLELAKDGVMEDQTFISLSNNENASADFVFGEDLSKEFNNNRANVYTFIGTEWAAGNTLPMSDQTTIVPVGVKIAAEGEYTFSIPEGTYGVGITLIDNETGARTNLGLMEYTVNLGAEQIDNRFLLEISPIKNTPTGIDNTDVQNSSVRKVMVDGTLYIIKDGKVFDAQGRQVK